MISKVLYDERMRKAFLFVGQRVTNEAVNIIYDEIKDGYTNRDFEQAIEDIMASDSYKITGPTIVRRLNLHRSDRFDREYAASKEKERQESIKIWNEGGFNDICQNHRCGSCDKVRCDEIARATISYMKDILAFEPDITLSAKEQIEQKRVYREVKKEKLIRDFPGAGVEKSYPRKTEISLDELQGRTTTRRYAVADIDDEFVKEQP
jgi:hypothetical protein